MKIIGFAGSTSSTSINKKLVIAAVDLITHQRPDVAAEVIDLRDYAMPLYSEDVEREHGVPDSTLRLLGRISAADALIISFAEHNGSYTAAYKNAFDWMSRVSKRVYDGKRVLALSTSPGPGGASTVLKSFVSSAPHFGAVIVGDLSVPRFHTAYDLQAGTLTGEWPERLGGLVALL